MTAPTEAEIRAAFREAWHRTGRVDLADAPNEASRSVDRLFDLEDFRESEIDALDELLSAAQEAIKPEYDALVERYRDALEEVAVRFAAEHPDAPRGKAKVAA